MKPSARSAIRHDVLTDYEVPSPDLVVRVLQAIPSSSRKPASHRGRVALQTAAVVLAAFAIGVATVGVRVSHGELALPAGLPFGVGGLHPPAASYSIVDAQYVSADTAWIIAQLYVHNGPTVLMNTTDGGKTWHEQFRIPDGSGIGSFHFWNAKDGELVENIPSTLPPSKVQGAPGSSNMIDRTYRTQDGGAHWQLVDRPTDWAAIGGTSFFLTEMEGWRILASVRGATPQPIQYTSDGGTHWSTVGTLPSGAWLGNFSFTDPQTGWLAASQSKSYGWDASGKPIPFTPPTALLWSTHDGGQTWAPIDLPLPAWPARIRGEWTAADLPARSVTTADDAGLDAQLYAAVARRRPNLGRPSADSGRAPGGRRALLRCSPLAAVERTRSHRNLRRGQDVEHAPGAGERAHF
ncbi:MAG: hypothetical protein E6J51_09260 [Chloroflexi bacterium]|nr:MAG: hypothetical protein E6J51_09260 [Chloroflexota bacterium]